jgi:hypothetical protein
MRYKIGRQEEEQNKSNLITANPKRWRKKMKINSCECVAKAEKRKQKVLARACDDDGIIY